MQFPCIGSGRNFEKSKGMKINVAMPSTIKAHYRVELEQYSMAFQQMNLPLAWRHLERAHILGQAWPTEHTSVHWKMLKFGFYIKNMREIIGQIPRLLVGGVKSVVGHIPVGNTGGAGVPPLKPMEIPRSEEQQADLQSL